MLLPDPLGPMSPKIWPRSTVTSNPSTARTPPKCFDRPRSSSTAALRAEQPPEGPGDPRVDEPRRPQIHREHDERAEKDIPQIPEEAKPLDQHALNEQNRQKGADDRSEPAQDRVGDGEGGQQYPKLRCSTWVV